MDDTRRCPYCAEEIPASAVRCRWCRSRVSGFDPASWHRDVPERRVAGVAAAVATPLALPLGVVRLAFIVLTFVHLVGPVLYAALWLLIPYAAGDEPPLARALGRVRTLAADYWPPATGGRRP